MTTAQVAPPSKIDADQFVHGLLAGLARNADRRVLNANHSKLHRAFKGVLELLKTPEFKSALDIDHLHIDFDLLYGLSSWFDRALTRAQRDLLIGFANPSYDRLQILIEPDEAEEDLRQMVHRDLFEKLAEKFWTDISAAE